MANKHLSKRASCVVPVSTFVDGKVYECPEGLEIVVVVRHFGDMGHGISRTVRIPWPKLRDAVRRKYQKDRKP